VRFEGRDPALNRGLKEVNLA